MNAFVTYRPQPFALVIDDDPVAADMLCAMINHLGWSARSASLGIEVEDILKVHKPDLVFLDIYLDNTDAPQMLDVLKGADYQGAICVNTGGAAQMCSVVTRLAESKGFPVLAPLFKPFELQDLKAVIDSLSLEKPRDRVAAV